MFARSQLYSRGVQVFLPQLQLPQYLQQRRHIVPLFPGYLFVRLDLATGFYVVAWAPGVKGFVGSGEAPGAVNEEVVQFLVDRATPDGIVAARPALQRGDEVEISHGPFAGLAAIVQRPPDARGRVRVLMQLLNRRSVRVQVPVCFVRSSWIA
jgi:transcriptional antiterminator RfaH